MNGFSLKRVDIWALLTICIFIGLSVAFIYSAQFKEEGALMSSRHWLQLKYAVMGFVGYGAICWFDYRLFSSLAFWIYGGTLFLLVAVFFFPEVNGSHRWIQMPGPDLQPSELAKISTIIVLANYLGEPGRDMDDWRTFFGCAALVGVPFFLIVAEPDLGTSLILAPLAVSMMLYMGVQRKVILIGIGSVIVFAGVTCFWVTHERLDDPPPSVKKALIQLPKMPLLTEYQKSRIRVFLTKDDLTADESWNKLQAQIAVGSGGMHGKGYLKGTQNILGFLPRTVAPTDFIFCVIAEETGFIGCLCFIALYSVLIGRCMRTAVRARENFGRLMALGIGVMVFCHVFVNIAMTIGVLPITGLPLPLMSYGGSFMVSTLLALGLAQSVYLRRRLI